MDKKEVVLYAAIIIALVSGIAIGFYIKSNTVDYEQINNKIDNSTVQVVEKIDSSTGGLSTKIDNASLQLTEMNQSLSDVQLILTHIETKTANIDNRLTQIMSVNVYNTIIFLSFTIAISFLVTLTITFKLVENLLKIDEKTKNIAWGVIVVLFILLGVLLLQTINNPEPVLHFFKLIN